MNGVGIQLKNIPYFLAICYGTYIKSMGKRFGQHFLKNLATAKKIVASLDLKSGDTIIEIGPGHGELTQKIKDEIAKFKNGGEKKVCIIAIEKDPQLVKELRERFLKDTEIEILEGDVRTLLHKILNGKSTLYPKPYTLNPPVKIVGNIPYYLTGRLLHLVSDLTNPPMLTVFMVQKEVAERIVAQPPHMNRLAAITQYWAETKIVRVVPKDQFDPPPGVDSAIIMLTACLKLPIPKAIYFRMAKIIFAQPRKTIVNNLTAASSTLKLKTKEEAINVLVKLGVDPRARPQDLGFDAIVKLARELF